MESAAPAFRPDPATGRLYTARRIVRSTDVTPSGRLRLDSFARYLQAAAEDDLADSGLLEHQVVWLVRRCAIAVRGFPHMGELVTLRTFCSGTGARWAERTTTLASPAGDLLQATAVWAAVDRASGRLVPPGEAFGRVYGQSADGRQASAQLSRRRPPDSGGASWPWPLRAADFDTAGHVNNAVHWAAAEDLLAEAGWLPAMAEMEYPRAILPGQQPRLVSDGDGVARAFWLLDGAQVLAFCALRQ